MGGRVLPVFSKMKNIFKWLIKSMGSKINPTNGFEEEEKTENDLIYSWIHFQQSIQQIFSTNIFNQQTTNIFNQENNKYFQPRKQQIYSTKQTTNIFNQTNNKYFGLKMKHMPWNVDKEWFLSFSTKTCWQTRFNVRKTCVNKEYILRIDTNTFKRGGSWAMKGNGRGGLLSLFVL